MSNADLSDILRNARQCAFRLLKLRPRSVKELQDRLQRKSYPAKVVDRVINELTEMELLDDAAFAKAWFQWRSTGRPVGLRRIAQELKDKGISKEVIDVLISGAKDDFDEEAVVRAIAEKRMGQRAQKDAPFLKRKKRVLDYLLRRGFSAGAVSKVVRSLKA